MQNHATSRDKKKARNLSGQKKSHNLLAQKKSRNLLDKKVMQPLGTKKITLDIILTEDGFKVMEGHL